MFGLLDTMQKRNNWTDSDISIVTNQFNMKNVITENPQTLEDKAHTKKNKKKKTPYASAWFWMKIIYL